DSLLKYVAALIESEYTTQSWTNYSNARNLAQNAFMQTYSTYSPAHTSLKNSFDDLNKAVNDLVKITTDISASENIPETFSLSQNYPNPFNPSTVINYQIATYSHVQLKVYDLLGREVATLVNEYKQPGKYNCEFRIENGELPSGVYLYNLRAGNFSDTKKLILLK
ncbi:MAG: T9SS type A sorting domain-containing protein, partial [Ignavibacteria bacterium]|nr:T9SS type A sorting domain-containing protein [Ignavibacteria bacterium]